MASVSKEYLHLLWQGIYDVLRIEKSPEEAQALLSESVKGCGLQPPETLEVRRHEWKTAKCLTPIFEHVKLNNDSIAKPMGYVPMPLQDWQELKKQHGQNCPFPDGEALDALEAPYFPMDLQEAGQQAPQYYKKLVGALAGELKRLGRWTDAQAYATVLFELCKKYMLRLPARTQASFISLYDEVRIAAAKQVIATQQGTTPDEARYVLLKGDFKGIQGFIYDGVSQEEAGEGKGTARNLRARSFLVSFLTDYFADYLIDKLHLQTANLLYAGGGHFLLLASPLSGDLSIDAIEQEVNRLLKQFGSATFLLAATEPATGQDLDQNFSVLMQQLGFALQRKKAQAHLSYLSDMLQPLNTHLGSYNSFLKRLGSELPYLDALIELRFNKEVLSEEETKALKKEALFRLDTGSDIRYFMPYSVERKDVNKPPAWEKKQFYKVIYLNYLKPTAYIPYDTDYRGAYVCKLFGTYAPATEESIGKNKQEAPADKPGKTYVRTLSFEELAKSSYNEDEGLSYPLLGVLRMDVDNLGALFEIGLGEKASVLHTAALSRELALFFSHYINYLAEKFDVYVLYAGGDDAFVVGSWYNILHFTCRLRRRFASFCCENRDLTFSAGIFFCHDRFPVPKFAELAAQAEEAAKSEPALGASASDAAVKNAVSVFGVVMKWELYAQMLSFAQTLLEHTATQEETGAKEGKLSRSMVHRILQIIKSSFTNTYEVNVMALQRNMTGLHYWFARKGYTHDVIEKAEADVVKEVIKVILSAFRERELLRAYVLPTSYVVLKTRKIKN
ncbi:MAG: hypothetical protein KatS3mg033_1184 [Thermonema sp.]|uniref:type III-A CRISPR-associated protein Cas10/Csm1 n=1 Tax=Thermonema sp. TaxID=2231181 RepID=UPI0021DC32F4|nr:hypothetical protein [Thermonema sp.]GIV39384.1 MAG: hypothetical protein KatS3mg033_1184 [Thermonema sp.]